MRQGERGVSIVESAIAMALTLLIVFGILEFGRVVYTYHALSNAARLGSRYAIVRGSGCGASDCPATASAIQDYVRGQAVVSDPTAITVTTTWSGKDQRGNPCSSTSHFAGCLVAVSATYAYTYSFVPVPPLTLSSTSQMVISQ